MQPLWLPCLNRDVIGYMYAQMPPISQPPVSLCVDVLLSKKMPFIATLGYELLRYTSSGSIFLSCYWLPVFSLKSAFVSLAVLLHYNRGGRGRGWRRGATMNLVTGWHSSTILRFVCGTYSHCGARIESCWPLTPFTIVASLLSDAQTYGFTRVSMYLLFCSDARQIIHYVM